MNKSEALAIDAGYSILPGGQGEHDFRVIQDKESLWVTLNNFAEQCGGLYRNGNPAELWTGDDFHFFIHFSSVHGCVSRIDREHQGRITLYWDERRERSYGHYQYGNAKQPFLSDWELSDTEKAQDDERIAKELAEMPPPRPRNVVINPYDQFREAQGLTLEQVRNPELDFDIVSPDNHIKFAQLGTLGKVNQMLQVDEYDRWAIILPRRVLAKVKTPQVGDIIIRKCTDEGYMHNYKGMLLRNNQVCYSPSPFWNPLYCLNGVGSPDCSGGPWGSMPEDAVSKLVLTGIEKQRYWYWGDGWAGAGLGVTYYCEVNVWHWID